MLRMLFTLKLVDLMISSIKSKSGDGHGWGEHPEFAESKEMKAAYQATWNDLRRGFTIHHHDQDDLSNSPSVSSREVFIFPHAACRPATWKPGQSLYIPLPSCRTTSSIAVCFPDSPNMEVLHGYSPWLRLWPCASSSMTAETRICGCQYQRKKSAKWWWHWAFVVFQNEHHTSKGT